MGILRAGYICFPVSPRNSPAAVAHLITKTSTTHIIVGREQAFQDLVSAAMASIRSDTNGLGEPRISTMPLFEDLYKEDWQRNVEQPPPYGRPKLEEYCLIAHSSGKFVYLEL